MLPTSRHNIQKILLEEQLFKKNYPVSQFMKYYMKQLGLKVEDTIYSTTKLTTMTQHLI